MLRVKIILRGLFFTYLNKIKMLIKSELKNKQSNTKNIITHKKAVSFQLDTALRFDYKLSHIPDTRYRSAYISACATIS